MRNLQKFFLSSIIFVFMCVAPFSAFAAINGNALDYIVSEADDYTKICPDFHYILDSEKPYQTLFVGNNYLVVSNSASGWYDFSDYDLIFVQTAVQPTSMSGTGINLELVGDKSFSVYGCYFEDTEWTELVSNGNAKYGLYVCGNASQSWENCVIGVNYNFDNIKKRVQSSNDEYFWYIDLYNSDYSTLDYNGYLSFSNPPLTYMKLISHVFVVSYLLPFVEMLVDEPFFLLVFLFGLVSFLFYIFYRFFIWLVEKKRRS